MGVVNVTPDSFSDGGLYLDRDAGDRARRRTAARAGAAILDVGGESTRPGRGGSQPGGGAAAGRAGYCGSRRGRGGDLGPHFEGRRRRRRARRRGGDRQRRHRPAWRPGDGGAVRGPGGHGGVDAHARHAAHDAGATPPTRTWSTTSRPFSPSARKWRSRRHRRGADLARPRDRFRQEPPSTTSSCCARLLGGAAPSWGARWSSAPRARASSARSPRGRRLGGTIASSVLAAIEGVAVLRVPMSPRSGRRRRAASAILG